MGKKNSELDDYLSNLSSLNESEIKTKLENFYNFNSSTIKFFKGIDSQFQDLLKSNGLNENIVDEIISLTKKEVNTLTSLKREISFVDESSLSQKYKNDVLKTNSYILYNMQLNEANASFSEFTTLMSKDTAQRKMEKEELENQKKQEEKRKERERLDKELAIKQQEERRKNEEEIRKKQADELRRQQERERLERQRIEQQKIEEQKQKEEAERKKREKELQYEKEKEGKERRTVGIIIGIVSVIAMIFLISYLTHKNPQTTQSSTTDSVYTEVPENTAVVTTVDTLTVNSSNKYENNDNIEERNIYDKINEADQEILKGVNVVTNVRFLEKNESFLNNDQILTLAQVYYKGVWVDNKQVFEKNDNMTIKYLRKYVKNNRDNEMMIKLAAILSYGISLERSKEAEKLCYNVLNNNPSFDEKEEVLRNLTQIYSYYKYNTFDCTFEEMNQKRKFVAQTLCDMGIDAGCYDLSNDKYIQK